MRTASSGRAFPVVLCIVILAMSVAPAYSLAGTTAATQQTDGTIRIPLPECDVAAQIDANGFCRFAGTGIQQISQTGEPSIPYKAVTVLLPPNANLSTVRATITNCQWTRLDGEWDILPIPPLAAGDCETTSAVSPTDEALVDGKNADIYNTDASFPLEPIGKVSVQVMRGWKMAQVFYAPYAYNPVEKKVLQLSGNAIEVTFERESLKSSDAGIDFAGAGQVREITANFAEMAPEYGGYALSADTGRYVIITTSAIEAASTNLTDFVASKEARGFTVQVVTEETWGGSTGNTAAENIRSWLQSNYISLNIKYVLLIGNPNPTTGDVPMKTCYPMGEASYLVPTDFYYAELTPNDWDKDGDGHCGEYTDDFSDDPPLAAEVAVGRIPYYSDNITNLDHILLKTIDYETAPASTISWRKNALLPMKPSDESTPGYQLGEEIKDAVLVPNSWTYHRVYDSNYGLSPAPETVPCTVTNVTNTWNGSDFGAVFWWTHGDSTTAVDIMTVANAATLHDDHPGFAFQCSCSNGKPEVPDNLGYSLLKNGCIATVSASRDSWYLEGQDSFAGTATNSGMTFEYSKRLIADEMYAGDALNDLKLDVSPGYEELWMNYLDFNLYGCPAVGPFTSTSDQPSPSVITYYANSVTTSSACLRGNLTSLGTADNVTVSFVWGTTEGGPYLNEATVGVRNVTGVFSHDLSNLIPGIVYYYKAKAVGNGTTFGLEKSFTTSTIPPSVTTYDATNVSTTSAQLNGNLSSLGTADNVSVSFKWGTSSGVYSNETTAEVKSTTGTFYFNLSSVAPGTTFYYRAKAVGHGDPVYGTEKSFTTKTTPSVTTNDASSITTTSARLNGDLTSLGTAGSVTVSFEWGTILGGPYTSIAAGVKYGVGTFSVELTSLTPGTTYYFKAKADGDGDPVYGIEKGFATSASITPPSVTTNDASNIAATSARLNGDLTSLGTATSATVSFQWGTSSGSYVHETAVDIKGAPGTFYFGLTSLVPGTTYYFKAKADGDGDPVYGTEKSFTTSGSITPPSVATNDASNITTTSATLNGDLTSLGTAGNVSVSFQWGTSSGSYVHETAVDIKGAPGTFYFDLTGLAPGTAFYFKAKAVGHGDPVYGTEKSFTTLRPPVVDSVEPGSGRPGQSMTVVVSGANFTDVTMVSFGTKVSVDGFAVDSTTQITVRISIGCDVTPGPKDISVTTPGGTNTLAGVFEVTEAIPDRPNNVGPANETSVATLTAVLSSSAFSHSCPARSHAASQWQVTAVAEDYSNAVFDSGTSKVNLTSITLPNGVVGDQELYWWRVRYQDNCGIWSDWSIETSFTLPDFIRAALTGPAEIRVDDSSSGVTGSVDGEAREEVPYSAYFSGTVILLSTTDPYVYEVVGTEDGSYTLTVARVVGSQSVVFRATGIPVSAGEVHQYVIDWDALSQGKDSVTIRIDSDGDGTFDRSVVVDGELDANQFASATSGRGVPTWVWACVGAGALLALGLVALLLIGRRKVQSDAVG